jgi:cytochrome c oxidase subunit 2
MFLDMLRWLPDGYGGVSSYAGDIDAVFRFIYWLTFSIFWLVTILMVVFLYRYHHRQGDTRRATYTHGNTALELTWTIIPAIVFIGIWFVSKTTWADIKAHIPEPNVPVRVTASQFAWSFAYPGPDGLFDTADDKTDRDLQGADKELHVPVNKVIKVVLRSNDVIHSFFVPSFRLKQDAVPGREINVWFRATKPGRYELPCAELCGPGHSGMVNWVNVLSDADYQAWVQKVWR